MADNLENKVVEEVEEKTENVVKKVDDAAEKKKANTKKWIIDIVAILALLAIMVFMVKGVPAMMGGRHDAHGNKVLMEAPTYSTVQMLE